VHDYKLSYLVVQIPSPEKALPFSFAYYKPQFTCHDKKRTVDKYKSDKNAAFE